MMPRATRSHGAGGAWCGLHWEGTTMAERGIPWRRDAEKALEEAKENKKRALVDFTAAPM
jgi:hypothetical protein